MLLHWLEADIKWETGSNISGEFEDNGFWERIGYTEKEVT